MPEAPDIPSVVPREIRCPRCGGPMYQEGQAHLPGRPRTKVQTAFHVTREFVVGFNVVPVVCRQCGYLELYHEQYLRP